jgi:tetratricopeptide (TPR) repeat protein
MTDETTILDAGGGDETRPRAEGDIAHLARGFVDSKLGAYHVMREIGHGSMGIVFLARHETSAVEVAIKVLPPSLSVSITVIKRFLREAESVAKLDHENIVKIHAVGEQGGIHWYAMQYVEGASLDRVLRQRKFSQRECAKIVAQVARALFFAHEASIIHRDIKPANILLTHKDRPVITDFGLAKPEKAATLTESGALVGTPIYMSPEQVRADRTLIDRRTDIYSLGVTLYEMLTGITPFESNSTQEILHKIEHVEPVPVRRIRPDVPKPLETICHKAIEKDPARRYQTAIELALDLERYLNGEPIAARPASIAYKAKRIVRRHPAIFALSAALVLAVLAFFALSMQTASDRQAKEVAEAAERDARFRGYLADGGGAMDREDWSGALAIFSQAIGDFPERPEAWVERGRCHNRLESYERAIADFEKALEADPTYHRARLHRGIVKCREGRDSERDEGLADIEATLHVLTDDLDALLESSRICLDAARIERSPSRRDSFIRHGDQRLQRLIARIREIESATDEGDRVRLLVTEDEALVLQGNLYEEHGLMDEARENYRRALEVNKFNTHARVLLAKWDSVPDGERQDMGAGAALSGSTWWAVLAGEGLSWAKKEFEGDTDFLKRAAAAMSIFGSSQQQEDENVASAASQELIDEELLAAEAFWREGKRDDAVVRYERVVALTPSLVEPYCRLAEHHLEREGGIDRAVEYVEAALKLNPSSPHALSIAARVYSRRGDADKVREIGQFIRNYHLALLSNPEIREALARYVDPDLLQREDPPPPPREDGS